jgi:hypothetical protein
MRKTLRDAWRIATPYWLSDEHWRGRFSPPSSR